MNAGVESSCDAWRWQAASCWVGSSPGISGSSVISKDGRIAVHERPKEELSNLGNAFEWYMSYSWTKRLFFFWWLYNIDYMIYWLYYLIISIINIKSSMMIQHVELLWSLEKRLFVLALCCGSQPSQGAELWPGQGGSMVDCGDRMFVLEKCRVDIEGFRVSHKEV